METSVWSLHYASCPVTIAATLLEHIRSEPGPSTSRAHVVCEIRKERRNTLRRIVPALRLPGAVWWASLSHIVGWVDQRSTILEGARSFFPR
eukprot:2129164-Prymnesium_polylepis.1